MTDLDLDAMRKRAEAATPGPWRWDTDDEGALRSDGKMEPYSWRSGGYPALVVAAHGMHTEGYVEVEPADADFIAHARQDVPALLAEVERLRAAVDRVRALHVEEVCFDGCCHYCDACTHDLATHRELVRFPCPSLIALAD